MASRVRRIIPIMNARCSRLKDISSIGGSLTYLEVPVSLCEDLFLQPPTLTGIWAWVWVWVACKRLRENDGENDRENDREDVYSVKCVVLDGFWGASSLLCVV